MIIRSAPCLPLTAVCQITDAMKVHAACYLGTFPDIGGSTAIECILVLARFSLAITVAIGTPSKVAVSA
jgi:hypothetical protein